MSFNANWCFEIDNISIKGLVSEDYSLVIVVDTPVTGVKVEKLGYSLSVLFHRIS